MPIDICTVVISHANEVFIEYVDIAWIPPNGQYVSGFETFPKLNKLQENIIINTITTVCITRLNGVFNMCFIYILYLAKEKVPVNRLKPHINPK